MITTSVNISKDGFETGSLLQEYLQDRGVWRERGPADVGYGLDARRTPAINARCQSDKITRMEAMAAAGVSLVPWTRDISEAAKFKFPLFARKTYGMGAKDLMPVFQPEELPWRVEAGWTWFSSIIPIERELRVWVWRGEVLDTYEKVMQRPGEYKAMGRNFGQGFEFRVVSDDSAAGLQSINAAAALGLDFCAIDLIEGKDGRIHVLEANTAPGVIRSGAQITLHKLADRIAEWCKADCPDFIGHAEVSFAEARRRQTLQQRRG